MLEISGQVITKFANVGSFHMAILANIKRFGQLVVEVPAARHLRLLALDEGLALMDAHAR